MTYEQLRKRIGELVPDVMKLEFGCEVKIKDEGENLEQGTKYIDDIIIRATSTDDDYWSLNCIGNDWDCEKSDFEILGRDPSLADVLRAIRETKEYKKLSDVLRDIEFSARSNTAKNPLYWEQNLLRLWDLSKPLSGQSQETLDFIGELIN